MEFLDIPIFDDDFYKMIFRLTLNFTFLLIIVRGFYSKNEKSKDYSFTYYMIGLIVFFLCFTLKKYELDIGMALGLFAIFGIIRYRTDPINIKDMTYLFVIIGTSVINALANSKMSYAEILGANLAIVIALYLLNSYKHHAKDVTEELPLSKTKIQYEHLENLKPEKQHILKADIQQLTGFEVISVKITEVNLINKIALITITYRSDL